MQRKLKYDMNITLYICTLLTVLLLAFHSSSGTTEFKFTPTNPNTYFGNVTQHRGYVNNITSEWDILDDESGPIEMAIEAEIFTDANCAVKAFNVHFNAYHSTSEGDGAIIIQAGSQYVSFLFDNDGFVLIEGLNIYAGGVGIYPSCGSSYLGNIPNDSTDIAKIFNNDTDEKFYDWRDGMVEIEKILMY